MRFFVALIVAAACHMAAVNAECPNACSSHGKCGAYDMCLCFRNWMSNDCSERICQFGLAHVDTPKGDLDASSGELTGPGVPVVYNDAMYPFGTTEQYPATVDLDNNVLTNTAHEYRECSNKGMCDRQTGNCACFEGYDGSACQRASCPSNADGVCSGHGTCETIKEIAERDFRNIYKLWDEDATMGCVCDASYSGSDCSERVCKWGADPLYYDDSQNIRFSNFTYQFYTTAANTNLQGNYSLVFYDAYGEDWQTAPLDWNANCETVTAALEELPNNAIPAGTVRCFKSQTTAVSGQDATIDPIVNTAMYVHSKYTLAFPGNPGKLKQISINKYLDGNRPTLFSDETKSTLGWQIYPNGFIGENVDFVPDFCEDVNVTLSKGNGGYDQLTGLTAIEAKLLKKCLGDSNGNSGDNVDVYDWDTGYDSTNPTKFLNPHLIKLIDATQDTDITYIDQNGDRDLDLALSKYPISRLCAQSDAGNRTAQWGFPVDSQGIYLCHNRNPPGFYAVLYFVPNPADLVVGGNFYIFNRVAQDYGASTQFYVYTTKGHLQLVNPASVAYTNTYAAANSLSQVANLYTNTLHLTTAATTGNPAGFVGQIDCETTTVGVSGALDCIKKNDYVIALGTYHPTGSNNIRNPVYVNMHQVKKIGREPKKVDGASISAEEQIRHQIVLDYSTNFNFQYNGGNTIIDALDSSAQVYKFYPPPLANQYHYAGECSKRGLCNTKTGLCACFPGYSEDNCGVVNAISN